MTDAHYRKKNQHLLSALVHDGSFLRSIGRNDSNVRLRTTVEEKGRGRGALTVYKALNDWAERDLAAVGSKLCDASLNMRGKMRKEGAEKGPRIYTRKGHGWMDGVDVWSLTSQVQRLLPGAEIFA